MDETDDLSPVDRKMVEESRAAYCRGEWEYLEDLIRRAEGAPLTLSNEQLLRYVENHKPPQIWYDEDMEGLF